MADADDREAFLEGIFGPKAGGPNDPDGQKPNEPEVLSEPRPLGFTWKWVDPLPALEARVDQLEAQVAALIDAAAKNDGIAVSAREQGIRALQELSRRGR